MARVLTISGSPSADSRTSLLLGRVAERLTNEGHAVDALNVRDLPPEDLIFGRSTSPGLSSAIASLERADGVVVGTPIYKASFAGVLKTFLDVLPQFGLARKTVLPLATGGSPAHVLALDYGLRPVLTSLGARHVVASFFIIDKAIQRLPSGGVDIEPETSRKLDEAIVAFADSLRRHARD
jgi:FMN reductase